MTQQIKHHHAPGHETAADTDWRHRAACRGSGVGGDTWFADGSSNAEMDTTRYAKAVCATCPARTPCGEWALSQPHPIAGVWGGLTEAERKAIKRREARARERASA